MDSLHDLEFEQLRKRAHALWGLDVKANKRSMVEGRLRRLVEGGPMESLSALIGCLERGADDPFALRIFDALSTNMTSFFRERSHFECLREELLEPLVASGRQRPLRFWSAACSKGCEPYSLAMVLRDTLPNIDSWSVKILASDLSQSVITEARRGIYEESCLRDLDPALVERHFVQGRGPLAGKYRVRPELSKLVTFALVNLNGPWVHSGPFDAIFCRNVMIYFDEETCSRLIQRLRGLLVPGGLLFVGSSEVMQQTPNHLDRIRPAVYRAA